ncbi:hypothetical protein L6452_19259 [Arctium lappa]|uniref:Uncharacterized protein n=1 Tax=Arctium lappa TaxID=4217 RepID=A0ACB9BCJ1_ARCLA|nr:hypothetical protein L6452_19259 [Arctium lappa]
MFGEVEDQPKKTKKESSRRSLQSSVADDLSLEAEDVLTSSGAEDLSSLRSTLQAKTPQDKRYILYLAEDLCPSFAQQVSHAFNA